MAGSWLKMRHDLSDDPAVIRLSDAVGIDEDAVIGKLFRLWSWADRHTVDGQAEGVGLGWVDRLARCQGFASALVRVGWLVETDEGLSFPRFDRHCSDTAKARALGKNRVEAHRNGPTVTPRGRPVTVEALPEKRREEDPPPPREIFAKLRQAWNADAGPEARRKPWKPDKAPDGAQERLSEPGWYEQALEAMARLRACRYFSTPVTLPQFVGDGFVERVLGGQYDEPKASQTAGKAAFEDRRPPAEWNAADRAALAATLRREQERAARSAS